LEHITEEAVQQSASKLIPNGSLLLGMYDTAALKSSIVGPGMTCNQAIAFSKLNDLLCNTVYVYFVVQYGKEEFKKSQRGVRQKNLNISLIKDIEIPLPPLSLQHRFAQIVEKIESQKQQAQAALAESEALFQGLLAGYFGEN
jgi:type I restriction enzyme S subunit